MGGLAVFLLKDWRKHISLALQMVAAVILSRGIITEIIRFFWHRSRPFVEQNFIPMISHADSASFPSGHATFFFAEIKATNEFANYHDVDTITNDFWFQRRKMCERFR